MVLHALDAVNMGFERVLVHSQDTDVFLILMHFLSHVETWMVAGTAKSRKCYPIQAIAQTLPKSIKVNLLSFHALMGCDTTSSFSGQGKKSCWKIFQNHPNLVSGVGRDGQFQDAKRFVCLLYGTPDAATIDHSRLEIFSRAKKGLDQLPPTRDALELHVAPANHQATIWLQTDKENMSIAPPTESSAWKNAPTGLEIVWSRLPPVPQACLELLICGCKNGCVTIRCTCYKIGLLRPLIFSNRITVRKITG